MGGSGVGQWAALGWVNGGLWGGSMTSVIIECVDNAFTCQQSSKLENVLIAFSHQNKNVGYCQVSRW